jgi:RimJ/RimL family protein N-acetyltransferase
MTEIRTERLVLRPIDPVGDVDAVHSWQSLPEVARYTPFEPRSREEVAASLARPTVARVLVLRDGVPVGDAMLLKHDPAGALEVGYELHPDHWGRGYATEVCRALVDLAESMFPGEPLEAVIAPENVASRIVLERSGFVETGTGTDELGPFVRFALRRA